MGAYILLITAELAIALFFKLKISNKEKQERLIAQWGMILIFLLLALKKETVGIDIAGYKEQYEIAAIVPWHDFDYVYFEKGYLVLTKVFSKLGISFQLFTALLYALWCHSIYMLIRKFSPNATISLVVFICYNFFVFSISGLRQTLAMALCIYAILLCIQFTKKTTIWAIVLNVAAIYIHKSAIVFFAILVVIRFMNRKIIVSIWALIVPVVFMLRPVIWKVIDYFYSENLTDFSLSGNFIFQVGMCFFVAFTYFYYPRKHLQMQTETGKLFRYDAFLTRSVFLCLISYIVFSGGTLLRSNMYFTLMLIPGIPMATSKYPYQLRFFLNMAMGMFMIILFYTQTLMINQLKLCPYLFFWQ